MGFLSDLAGGLSGQNKNRRNTSDRPIGIYSSSPQPQKKHRWQCSYCGKTYTGVSLPQGEKCRARGKDRNGHLMYMHSWRQTQ